MPVFEQKKGPPVLLEPAPSHKHKVHKINPAIAVSPNSLAAPSSPIRIALGIGLVVTPQPLLGYRKQIA